ncbi:MAG: ferrochelatase [Vampirovibrionales bacterium]|nr:ferrochelatase [Vampirovibrionales bacterium]
MGAHASHVNVPTSPARLGVVLMNMGGPDDRASVRPFLRNLFSDPDIIRLPLSRLLQPALARWIVWRRGALAEAAYARMGGGSPQLPLTRLQAEALQQALAASGLDARVYVAMRYWRPFSEEVVRLMAQDGVTHLAALSLYPHFSYTTTGSSVKALRAALAQSPLAQTPLSIIAGYCRRPAYLAALAARIQEGLQAYDWTCPAEAVTILFSAHSLPVSHVRRTRDPYATHLDRCAHRVMRDYFPRNPWTMAYQSKVGRMPWLAPSTLETLSQAAARGADNILTVPISFVSDHIETLVELDEEALPMARRLGVSRCARAPVMNAHADFIELLAALTRERVMNRWRDAFSMPVVSTQGQS